MEAALGRDVEGDLEQSARAGVARLVNGQVQFDHPLVASAVHRTATPAKRRSVHRALAAVVTEPEQHARHLALAAEAQMKWWRPLWRRRRERLCGAARPRLVSNWPSWRAA